MTIRSFTLAFLTIGLLFFTTASPSIADKNKTGPAINFVQELGDKALVSLTDTKVEHSVRKGRTKKLLKNYFSIKTIARFALGVNWRIATKKEKKEYFTLFEDMIVETYTTRFEGYSGQSFIVDKAHTSGKRDTIVKSRIIQKDGPDLHLEWRVRKKKNKLRVVDVIVENISMNVTHRSDFSAVVQRGGGKVEALLAKLRRKKEQSEKISKK